jgi:hypothetical protein
VNVVLAAAGFAVGAVLVIFVWYEGKIVGVGGARRDSHLDPERQPLIPEEDEEE